MRFFIRYVYQVSRMLWLLLKPISTGVRLLMVRDNQVLLVKHVYEPNWYLPGGAVEQGETLDAAVRREAFEEAGATLHDLQLFGAYTNFEHGKSDHIIVYISSKFDLTCEGDDEIEFCQFFDLNALPERISPGSANRIHEYLSGELGTYGRW
jgi:8-oxo-dGTP pyrophosphatase MutT (NUDIX family)